MFRSIVVAASLATAASLVLSACAANPPAFSEARSYDFGIADVAPSATVPGPTVPIKLADISAPPDLDTDRFRYRLLYSDPRQPHVYAGSHWTMPPAQLLTARLRQQLAKKVQVLAPGDAAKAPVLKIDLDEFAQVFDQPGVSRAAVRLQASVFKNGELIAQQDFSAGAPAVSADAAGGALALANASDAAIDQIIAWLANQPL